MRIPLSSSPIITLPYSEKEYSKDNVFSLKLSQSNNTPISYQSISLTSPSTKTLPIPTRLSFKKESNSSNLTNLSFLIICSSSANS